MLVLSQNQTLANTMHGEKLKQKIHIKNLIISGQKDIMVVFCYQKMMLPHKNGVLACIYQPRSKHKSL